MKMQCLGVLSTLMVAHALAQVDTAWVRRYNGTDNAWDEAHAIAVDAAGNVYVTGISNGMGDWDYATVKYGRDGTELWTAVYAGPTGGEDRARAIAVDDAGNVHVTGFSEVSNNNRDVLTIKYLPTGDTAWVRTHAVGTGDIGSAIAVDDSGNVYITGEAGTFPRIDYITIKYGPTGDQLWTATYNGGSSSARDQARAVAVDVAGNVYVTGGSQGTESFDVATIKYSPAGESLWVARYDRPDHLTDQGWCLELGTDGSVYVAGYSSDSTTDADYLVVKYGPDGVEQWVARYNGTGNGRDEVSSLALDDAGNAYVTGTSIGAGSDQDFATVKYNAAGVEQWVTRYTTPGSRLDRGYSVGVDGDGNVYAAGTSFLPAMSWDYTTIKYDAGGAEQWVATYGCRPGEPDDIYAMALDDSGNIYVTGRSVDSLSYFDYATIKYTQSSGVAERGEGVRVKDEGAGMSRTIVRGELYLKSEGTKGEGGAGLLDISGSRVMELLPGINDLSRLAPGVYFVREQDSRSRGVRESRIRKVSITR